MDLLDVLNGNLVPNKKIPRSQIYADGIFETIAVYKSKVLWFQKHYQRFMRGIRTLKYELPEGFSENSLKTQIEELLQINKVQYGRIRILCTRKDGGLFYPMENEVNILIQTFPLKEIYAWKNDGIKVGVYHEILLYPSVLKQFKNCNALPYVLAAQDAYAHHLDDNILLSYQNQLAELSNSNLFFVKKHQLYTPDLNTGCLQGTMRENIIELAEKLYIPFKKSSITVEELHEVTEIFATNAIHGIVPIRFVQGISKTFSTSHNEITRLLYEELLKSIHE